MQGEVDDLTVSCFSLHLYERNRTHVDNGDHLKPYRSQDKPESKPEAHPSTFNFPSAIRKAGKSINFI